MDKNQISVRRRHLMFAGVAAAAAPGALFASECVPAAASMLRPPTVAQLLTEMTGDKLIVSGRVIGSDCRGIAGALVEIWSAGSSRGTSGSTDGEGRFLITSVAPSHGKVHIRVSYNGQTLVTQRELSGEPASGDDVIYATRDESNTWHTTMGLAFV